MFEKEQNGFSKNQVNNFIKKQRVVYENLLLEQRQKITELKAEVFKMREKINDYKRNEKELCDAFEFAMVQNQEVKKAQDNIYKLELERVRNLYNKYRHLFEEKLITENKLIEENLELEEKIIEEQLEDQLDSNFNILEEIGKDVDMEEAFSGFDFYDNNPKRAKAEKTLKKIEKKKQKEKSPKTQATKTKAKTETKDKEENTQPEEIEEQN